MRRTQGPSRSWGSGTGWPSERRKAKFSGSPTKAAPRAAARPTRASAVARLRSTSVVDVICTTAARTRDGALTSPASGVGGGPPLAPDAGHGPRRHGGAGRRAAGRLRFPRGRGGGAPVAHAWRLSHAHSAKSGQTPQAGRRASHTLRPWKMTRSVVRVHRSRGTRAMRRASTAAGSSPSARPSRFVTRRTCVSTAMPSLTSKAWPRTTFAVLRPMPGRVTSASMVRGTSPP